MHHRIATFLLMLYSITLANEFSTLWTGVEHCGFGMEFGFWAPNERIAPLLTNTLNDMLLLFLFVFLFFIMLFSLLLFMSVLMLPLFFFLLILFVFLLLLLFIINGNWNRRKSPRIFCSFPFSFLLFTTRYNTHLTCSCTHSESTTFTSSKQFGIYVFISQIQYPNTLEDSFLLLSNHCPNQMTSHLNSCQSSWLQSHTHQTTNTHSSDSLELLCNQSTDYRNQHLATPSSLSFFFTTILLLIPLPSFPSPFPLHTNKWTKLLTQPSPFSPWASFHTWEHYVTPLYSAFQPIAPCGVCWDVGYLELYHSLSLLYQN